MKTSSTALLISDFNNEGFIYVTTKVIVKFNFTIESLLNFSLIISSDVNSPLKIIREMFGVSVTFLRPNLYTNTYLGHKFAIDMNLYTPYHLKSYEKQMFKTSAKIVASALIWLQPNSLQTINFLNLRTVNFRTKCPLKLFI